jgi:two-component sensor histidine kinase
MERAEARLAPAIHQPAQDRQDRPDISLSPHRAANLLQVAASLLHAQARVSPVMMRDALDRAASRVCAIPIIQDLVDQLGSGGAVRFNELLTQAMQLASDGTDLGAAHCSLVVHSAPFSVSPPVGLMFGLMAYELARDVVADVENGRESIHIKMEAVQNRRLGVYLTVSVAGPPDCSCCGRARETVQTLASSLGGQVNGSEIPGGTLLFMATTDGL